MERYFFHVTYGETTRDNEGFLLPSLQEARAAAVQLLGEMLRDQGDSFWAKPDLVVTVTNADNLTLWTLSVTGAEAASVSMGRLRAR
ncbi:MAG: DUF6894 family protein [Phenylobacterium sp.]|uniref:DUF6894 family protein n=1 Tax=Phenylobacterium sp. TaxID=1871053 RepID=UPI003919D01A